MANQNRTLKRDEEGKFTSGSSSRNSGGSASNKPGGPGRGWHGDSKGHAEAGSHSHDNDRKKR